MIELIALLVALATPDDRLNYLAVGHMSGSAGLRLSQLFCDEHFPFQRVGPAGCRHSTFCPWAEYLVPAAHDAPAPWTARPRRGWPGPSSYDAQPPRLTCLTASYPARTARTPRGRLVPDG